MMTISMVIYHPDKISLSYCLTSTSNAVAEANVDIHLIVIDNSTSLSESIDSMWLRKYWPYSYSFIQSRTNSGFGIAHNLALNNGSKYHLILNPDLEPNRDALVNALYFMTQHPECGLLAPYATWPGGELQRLCKRYPTVFDLFLRGFAPEIFKKKFHSRLAHYELADKINSIDVFWDPPIVSGCFMLFRTDVLQQLAGFDPRFFLYFEDFDISLRAGKISRIAYVPQVKVVHRGGNASRKGWRHIWMFGRSMVTFFNIHGWRWW